MTDGASLSLHGLHLCLVRVGLRHLELHQRVGLGLHGLRLCLVIVGLLHLEPHQRVGLRRIGRPGVQVKNAKTMDKLSLSRRVGRPGVASELAASVMHMSASIASVAFPLRCCYGWLGGGVVVVALFVLVVVVVVVMVVVGLLVLAAVVGVARCAAAWRSGTH